MSTNVQLAEHIYSLFGRGDIPAVLAQFHPSLDWREAEGNPYQMDGTPWIGPQAVLQNGFMPLGADWEGFTITMRTLHDAGDHVVMEGRYSGTYKPTGRRLDAQVCHILRFRDGKLAGFQQYADTAQMQAVMGTR